MLSRIASRVFRSDSVTSHLLENGLSAVCSVHRAEISSSSSLRRLGRNGDDRRRRRGVVREALELENEDPGYLESLENIEEVLGSAFDRSSRSSEVRRRAEQQFRRRTRERIQAQNLAKLDVQDGNLLTWSAKRQIVELAIQDPMLWTPTALSERFPATPQQIVKLLKQKNFLPRSPEQIFFHDRVVLQRLRTLAATRKLPDGAPDPDAIHPGFLWLLDTKNWDLLIHADGNAELPLSERQFVEERQEDSARDPQYLGPFEALYVNTKLDRGAEPAADPRVARFIARCEKQRKQLQMRLISDFDPDSVERSYGASGVLPPAWTAGEGGEEVERLQAGNDASHAFNMFSASSSAARRDWRDWGSLADDVDKELSRKVSQLVQTLDKEPDLPKKAPYGKLKAGQRPLGFPERAGLEAVRIFRYHFRKNSRR